MVKNAPAMQETQVQSLGREDPLEKEMATQFTPVILSKKSHGQRSLAATVYGITKESDTTEQLNNIHMVVFHLNFIFHA